jgi:hypothetical protein|tara:strand:- start:856 stop:978 length:123 start_codon:yes stop_codon:yes gene_type:complete
MALLEEEITQQSLDDFSVEDLQEWSITYQALFTMVEGRPS